MALTSTYMGLTIWDQATDGYDHNELANNWTRVDSHDHSSNGGRPLPADAIPQLGSNQIGPGAVGTAQLADGSVTNPKIATGAVNGRTLANSAVTLGKLADGSVNTDAIVDDAVTGPKIADSSSSTGAAIVAGHINNNAVVNRHLADGSVTSSKLSTNAVHTGNVGDEAITYQKISNDSVATAKLADNAVTTAKLAPNSVTAGKFSNLPAVYVKCVKARDISNGEDHVIFDNAVYDTDGMYHSNAPAFVTVQTRGLYVISAGVYWQDHETDPIDSGHRRMYIRRNGGEALVGSGPASTGTDWRNFDNNGNPVGLPVHSLYQSASTVQTRGLYVISAGVYWQDHETDPIDSGHRRMYIRRNGGEALVGSGPASTGTDWRNFDNNGNPVGLPVHSLYQSASTVTLLQGGDAIDVAIFSGQPGGSQYMPNNNATHLSLMWLAPLDLVAP